MSYRHVKLVLIVCLLSNALEFNAQEIFFGTNEYVEYQRGDLPVILSAPHGGTISPAEIPDRSCGNAVTTRDRNTTEVALEISNQLFQKTGCYPHVIISHLHRSKLDPNRSAFDATCDQAEAVIAYDEYHKFMDTAIVLSGLEHQAQNLFIDVHGHGHPIDRIEWGYLLSKAELGASEDIINLPIIYEKSSIKKLVENNLNGLPHSELLSGAHAIGSYLDNQGFPGTPSETEPFPDFNSDYFTGGFITKKYSGNNPDFPDIAHADGVQMELYFDGIRDTEANRLDFANACSDAIISFLEYHHGFVADPCHLNLHDQERATIKTYPNPISAVDHQIIIEGLDDNEELKYNIINSLGQVLESADLINNKINLSTKLEVGWYILKISNGQEVIHLGKIRMI